MLRSKSESPILTGAILFFITIAFGLLLVGIQFIPWELKYRLTLSAILLLAAFMAYRPIAVATWKQTAGQRVSSWLISLGTGLVLRGSTGILFSIPDIKAKFLAAHSEAVSEYQFELSLISGGSGFFNGFLIVTGGIMLLVVFWRLTPPSSLHSPGPVPTQASNALSAVDQVFDLSLTTYDSDLPPKVEYWVGREPELALLGDSTFSVLALTGIGGQGKSTLAAHALETFRKRNRGAFWDWRDCREQSDRFRTQVTSVLQRITGGTVSPQDVASASFGWLAKYFFQKSQGVRGFIVFDNVDSYVNVELSLFTDEVSAFIEEALRVDHLLTIVFTCRPRIAYPSPRFREVYIRGLDPKESELLFRERLGKSLTDNVLNLVPDFCKHADGHPLWLSLIASQISRKPETAERILEKLKESETDTRATAVFRALWVSLNENQKAILRCMSEIPNALDEQAISDLLSDEFENRSRFTKAFKALKSLSLVTEKSSTSGDTSRYDLHPLVRSFVRYEFPGIAERTPQIMRILVWCDKTIVEISSRSALQAIERTMMKAELQINSGNHDDAIETIAKSHEDLVVNGLQEEFIRLARMAFIPELFDLNTAAEWRTRARSALLHHFVRRLVEGARPNEAEDYLSKYEPLVDRGTIVYVWLCNTKAYVAWFQGLHTDAIRFARRGIDIAKQGSFEKDMGCAHTMALALRDSGSIDEALEIFLKGMAPAELLREDFLEARRGSPLYGNIGRCYQLAQKFDFALSFLTRSFSLLERESDSVKELNRGYALFWIGQCLEALGQIQQSKAFVASANRCWSLCAPQRAEETSAYLERIAAIPCDSGDEIDCSQWVDQWLSSEKLSTDLSSP